MHIGSINHLRHSLQTSNHPSLRAEHNVRRGEDKDEDEDEDENEEEGVVSSAPYGLINR